MKHIIKTILPLISICMVLSCGEDKAKSTKENIKIINEVSKATDYAASIKEQMKVLSTKAPLTDEQFKQWSQDNFGDFKRDTFITDIIPAGSKICSANYKKDNSSEIFNITIVDGAGEKGSYGLAQHRLSQTLEINNEKPNKYEKTVVKNGIKALEKYSKAYNKHEIIFLHDIRFGVNIESKNMDINELWSIIAKLNLDELTKMGG